MEGSSVAKQVAGGAGAQRWSLALMITGLIFCLSPWGNAAIALIAGVVLALAVGNPYAHHTKLYSQKLLSYSIVGLGAGMNLITVAKVGFSGLGYTVVSIGSTLALGFLIGKILHSDRETSMLITVGTAICGGSAIAAVAPVIKAKPQSMSVALGTVFLLNALALFIFPSLGHYFGLTQAQFGLWSALAIHDTSSVVGATMQYGPEALATGTTVKLARALWIVPLTVAFSQFSPAADGEGGPKKKPWFILGFLIVAAIVTWVPELAETGHVIEKVARKGLVVTLFLIGCNLTASTLKAVGLRPLIQGVVLWLVVLVSTLVFVKAV